MTSAEKAVRPTWAERYYTEPCSTCGARVGKPCMTASGYVTMRHASRRRARPIPPGSGAER